MTGREAEDSFYEAVGDYLQTHKQNPYCIIVGFRFARALITDDGTHRSAIPEAFKNKDVEVFAREDYRDYTVNVVWEDEFKILTLTQDEWDKSQK